LTEANNNTDNNNSNNTVGDIPEEKVTSLLHDFILLEGPALARPGNRSYRTHVLARASSPNGKDLVD
jgi:hypothetical protein